MGGFRNERSRPFLWRVSLLDRQADDFCATACSQAVPGRARGLRHERRHSDGVRNSPTELTLLSTSHCLQAAAHTWRVAQGQMKKRLPREKITPRRTDARHSPSQLRPRRRPLSLPGQSSREKRPPRRRLALAANGRRLAGSPRIEQRPKETVTDGSN
jgi:hypothetical protein